LECIHSYKVVHLQVTKAQADTFTPGKSIPQCCVVASWKGEATTVRALNHRLKFSGTQTLESYLLYRGKQFAKSCITIFLSTIPTLPWIDAQCTSVDGPSTPTQGRNISCGIVTSVPRLLRQIIYRPECMADSSAYTMYMFTVVI